MAADGAPAPTIPRGLEVPPRDFAHPPLPRDGLVRWTRDQRLEEFFRRLMGSPACHSADGAFERVRAILNAVEDELSGLPYDPCHPRSDGRLYPAKPWFRCRTPGRPDLRRYRFKAHVLFIGPSGAILIAHKQKGAVLHKPAEDGACIDLDHAVPRR